MSSSSLEIVVFKTLVVSLVLFPNFNFNCTRKIRSRRYYLTKKEGVINFKIHIMNVGDFFLDRSKKKDRKSLH